MIFSKFMKRQWFILKTEALQLIFFFHFQRIWNERKKFKKMTLCRMKPQKHILSSRLFNSPQEKNLRWIGEGLSEQEVFICSIHSCNHVGAWAFFLQPLPAQLNSFQYYKLSLIEEKHNFLNKKKKKKNACSKTRAFTWVVKTKFNTRTHSCLGFHV